MKQVKITIDYPVDVEKAVLEHVSDFENFLCKNYKVEFASEVDITDQVFKKDEAPVIEKKKSIYDWGE